MYHQFARLRARSTSRTLAHTSYCEECGGVCTPSCRQDALLERRRNAVQRIGLYRA